MIILQVGRTADKLLTSNRASSARPNMICIDAKGTYNIHVQRGQVVSRESNHSSSGAGAKSSNLEWYFLENLNLQFYTSNQLKYVFFKRHGSTFSRTVTFIQGISQLFCWALGDEVECKGGYGVHFHLSNIAFDGSHRHKHTSQYLKLNKLTNVHIINEFSKHTIFTLYPLCSLKQQDCSLRLQSHVIVLPLQKAVPRSSDGDEGGDSDEALSLNKANRISVLSTLITSA